MDYQDKLSGIPENHFWFKGKYSLIRTLLSKLNSKGLKILNIGAGTGEDLAVIKEFGTITAIDISQDALVLIPDNLVSEKILCNACEMKFPDNSFDLAVAFDLLEHIDSDSKCISEIKRVLKPGGHFIFTVPAFKFLYSYHDKNLNHFRRYDKKDISDKLREFTKLKLGYWVFTLFPLVIYQRLLKPGGSNKINPILNELLYRVLELENRLIKYNIPFPFGSTLYGIYRKGP